MSDPRIMVVIETLSSLIVHHAGLTASEQYCSSRTPDSSDEFIEAHKKWVEELRDIRQRFENLVTGLL